MEATEPHATIRVEAMDPEAAALAVAAEIGALVREKPDAVLGLATGRSPRGVYAELVRMHREGGLDLSRVRSFNLDEYLGLGQGEPRSLHAFMQEHLWCQVNADPERVRIPDGRVAPAQLVAHCEEYERAIEEAGGIDLQLLGIGRNGHIAFNEPGTTRGTRTRVVELDRATREDAAGEFGGASSVPPRALTVGVATILAARRIRVVAFGAAKADAVHAAIRGAIGPACPASYLRGHPDVRLYADAAALPAD